MIKLIKVIALLYIGFLTASVVSAAPAAKEASSSKSEIKIIYDAFGKQSAYKKDWGYAAIVEIGGKRILFDTGNDGETFKHNAKVANADLSKIDFVVLSHRHSDHMAGLNKVLEANPKVKIYAPREGFGIYGSSLPSSFYRKDAELANEYRYYDGSPPETMKFGSAWEKANFQVIDQTTEIAPGIWAIAQVSDAPGTKEMKELSLAIDTPNGLVILVGCSHPGIENIVQAAAKINPKIHLVAGGFHLVTAPDETIANVANALRDKWKVNYIAPGHCTGEPTFNALRKTFGDHYVYAGLGAVIKLEPNGVIEGVAMKAALFQADDLGLYRQLAAESHDAIHNHFAHSHHKH
ncbi:MBL fold metallo-hydrolase [Polynucleobacter sp. AP-Ainpum-60-G11]|uniref:MBL fold metallo-hydrolase n=1 Tax=Polynucleobacter sp. AP-Ainpum-60-G11 TaxID=2576926 RepID=UPI001BFD208C|nr:MBL fold metallo-hydrolase [Polynucleobacter sp. AP-Ainpum-60-G11]QWE26007.1 MBL fold metallo-hydrolase [Polynucleobacter sp. AP-Ainpum-60-G11]